MRRQSIVLLVLFVMIAAPIFGNMANMQYQSTLGQNSNSSPTIRPISFIGSSGTITQDYIDAQSTVDSHADNGSHDVFNDLKATDATMDSMSEANTGIGPQTSGNTAETDLGYRNLGIDQSRGLLVTPSYTGPVTDVHVRCYASGGSGSGKVFIALHSSLNIISNGISGATVIGASPAWHTFTFATSPILSASTEYVIFIVSEFNYIRLLYSDTSATDYGHTDNTNSYSSPTNPTDATNNNDNYEIYVHYGNINYELNLEMAFTSVTTTYTEYDLSIKTGVHGSGSESFNVRVWNGTWQTVITGLSWSAWNNVSVSAYKNTTMYILFIGQTESADGTQDTFNVDSVLLAESSKTWNQAGGAAELWFNITVDIPHWRLVCTAILYFWTELYVLALEGFLILFGLILIPVSTMYLVRGGRESMSNDKVFFFLVLFFVGWALLIGGIMP